MAFDAGLNAASASEKNISLLTSSYSSATESVDSFDSFLVGAGKQTSSHFFKIGELSYSVSNCNDAQSVESKEIDEPESDLSKVDKEKSKESLPKKVLPESAQAAWLLFKPMSFDVKPLNTEAFRAKPSDAVFAFLAQTMSVMNKGGKEFPHVVFQFTIEGQKLEVELKQELNKIKIHILLPTDKGLAEDLIRSKADLLQKLKKEFPQEEIDINIGSQHNDKGRQENEPSSSNKHQNETTQ